jgi:hypothetical protein
LKGRQNTKTIVETKHKYQIAEAEGNMKYLICRIRISITPKKTEHKITTNIREKEARVLLDQFILIYIF